MSYTDIHCHILPGLDDGAEDVYVSVNMARKAYRSGVKTIVATVHSYGKGEGFVPPGEYSASLKLLREALHEEHIDIELVSGMECYADDDFCDKLENGLFLPIRQKYLLVEFGFDDPIGFMRRIIDETLEYGLKPVIAHPERYGEFYSNPPIIKEFVKKGCLLQANKGSFFGNFGSEQKDCAKYMLENGLLYAIASDAHGDESRTPDFSHIADYIEIKTTKENKLKLLDLNPAEIVKKRNG